ncbi:uncharacterized protein HMPREF1541_03206 [Cyphellophora europaea CBS 101466]|uniref:Amidohydrolase-related domain-containing protein n=1 Tax=Cyphellophora europaea (strain CBS 101466) TaxID=1220924 RepID=W2RXM2_CYPE1|nr:uncharacterized protein HMPREF1541_03206 [Cyphellophora europaea CBS 101466]ETN41271.1 hypothetical protein HMPREF1541_03206 [Cyphellophora europaea CBS 101466]
MDSSEPTLFENATIICYDEETQSSKILRNASLLVEDGRVTQLAEGSLLGLPSSTEVIDATGKTISPGFINTHHHMWQSAFRTLGPDTFLSEYFAGRYSQQGPSGQHFTPEDVYLGQLACALEMIDGGTTTVLDHAHGVFTNEHVDAALEASFHSGLRIFFAHAIQEIKTTGYTTGMATEKLLQLSRDPRFADKANPMALGVAYDGWAFAPVETNVKVMDMIINHNNTVSHPSAPFSLITSHHVAGPFPATNSPTLLDSFPTSALSQPNLTTPAKVPVVFSHASFLSNNDAKVLRSNPHASISTTPESEAHYGHTSVGADLCQDCASLGVDTHFTFSSFMPFQARFWLQSQRYGRYRQTLADNGEVPINNPMNCEAAFLLMTQKGGEALGRKDLGVISVGAQADLVLIDTKTRAGLWAVRDPVAAVVLHLGGAGDIEGVMVQGKWLKKDHEIMSPLVGPGGKDVAVDSVRDRFEVSALRIQRIWEALPRPVFEEGAESMSGAKYGKCKTVSVKRKGSQRV